MRGAYLLALGPGDVEGRFVREIMLLLDGISVGGQSTRDRGFTPVMSVRRLSSLCNCLASAKFGRTVAMCLPARVVARNLTSTTASIDTISLRGRGWFWPAPGRRQTSSTLSNGNLLCWFLIN